MTNVIWVSDESELSRLIAYNSEVVVDFTAPAWCRPCEQFIPHFDRAASMSDSVFAAVDVDESPWAVVEYGIQAVPSVLLFRGAEHVRHLKSRSAITLLSELKE